MESIAKFFNHDFEYGNFRLYDKNGNLIYNEHCDKFWCKLEYNKNGNLIYCVYSDNYWYKLEYDKYENISYFKDSDGYVFDRRPKCENKTVIIDGIEYELRRK